MDTHELSFEEKIKVIESDLPIIVQKFLHSPERDRISLSLSRKYALHADQAGAFEQAYLYMLLGVNTPEDFVQDLKEAGISSDSVKNLTNDINEMVFKKLLRGELAEADTNKQSYRSAPMEPALPVPNIAPIQTAAPQAPAPAAPTPSFNLVRPDALVTAPIPTTRTMQSDMEALQHPSIPNTLHHSQVTPAMSFQTASVPFNSFPIVPKPVFTQSTPAVAQPHINTPQSLPIAPTTSGSDPYREPLL